jgi:chromosome segregation ATPase
MDVSAEIRDRIIAAADQLFEQAGREQFPVVDAVRRLARANMGDTSAVMKEWRKSKTSQTAPVAIEIPDTIREANRAALATLWSEAQELANESLRTAQAAWDIERGEADKMRTELADAYETQASELKAAQDRVAELEQTAQAAATAAAGELAAARAELRAELDQATRATAEAREKVAGLDGQLKGLKDAHDGLLAQHDALLARLAPQDSEPPAGGKGRTPGKRG